MYILHLAPKIHVDKAQPLYSALSQRMIIAKTN